jgi:hypothetical protein
VLIDQAFRDDDLDPTQILAGVPPTLRQHFLMEGRES